MFGRWAYFFFLPLRTVFIRKNFYSRNNDNNIKRVKKFWYTFVYLEFQSNSRYTTYVNDTIPWFVYVSNDVIFIFVPRKIYYKSFELSLRICYSFFHCFVVQLKMNIDRYNARFHITVLIKYVYQNYILKNKKRERERIINSKNNRLYRSIIDRYTLLIGKRITSSFSIITLL